MAYLRKGSTRGVAVGLLIGASLCALYGIALLATAVNGSNTPSSVLLVGFGFGFLIVSVILFAIVMLHCLPDKPGGDKS
jgi:hypothetical protein